MSNCTFGHSQLEWLRKNYATCDKEEAEATLGKCWKTIQNRAGKIGLRRAKKRPANYMGEKAERLRKLLDTGIPLRECAEIMNENQKTLESLARRHGLKSKYKRPPSTGVKKNIDPMAEKAEYHGFSVNRFKFLRRYQHAWKEAA